jgi:hypothetical protein
MPAYRGENLGSADEVRYVTEEEWISNFLAKCEPLSQRQMDILTFEFQKAADDAAEKHDFLNVQLAS